MSLPSVPDTTAVRTALWRALHVEVDGKPHVLDDTLGARLANPPEGWRERGDMHPQGTRGYRASIVGRARFIEETALENFRKGVAQYVLLGAGLDTFAQRKPDAAQSLRVFEIDRADTQEWKRRRLEELKLPQPVFVPVNFEKESWREKLGASGFENGKPATIASTGVSMYLTREANEATLREVASFAPGTCFLMTFLLTLDLVEPADRAGHEMVYERAKAAGTPFVSFFRPEELLALARGAGFRKAVHVSRAEIIARYFAGRADGLVPSSGEEFLVAGT